MRKTAFLSKQEAVSLRKAAYIFKKVEQSVVCPFTLRRYYKKLDIYTIALLRRL